MTGECRHKLLKGKSGRGCGGRSVADKLNVGRGHGTQGDSGHHPHSFSNAPWWRATPTCTQSTNPRASNLYNTGKYFIKWHMHSDETRGAAAACRLDRGTIVVCSVPRWGSNSLADDIALVASNRFAHLRSRGHQIQVSTRRLAVLLISKRGRIQALKLAPIGVGHRECKGHPE